MITLDKLGKIKSAIVEHISEYFAEFSNNTTIHGIKYLVGRERSNFEKLWWLSILCGSIFTCQKLIGQTWNKWEENPVLLSFRQNSMQPWEIPFPAVTVCPQKKIDSNYYNLKQKKVYYYKKQMWYSGSKDEFINVLYFCGSHHSIKNHSLHVTDLEEFIRVAPLLHNNLVACLWKPDPKLSCQDLFSPILTMNGVCFTFNSLDGKDLFTNLTYVPEDFSVQPNILNWSIDNNYKGMRGPDYPYRATSILEGLMFYFHPKNNSDKSCGSANTFKILVHHPAEIPTISTEYVEVGSSDFYDIWIKPEVTVSQNLENYKIDRRQCFYSYERQLYFYKIYSESNCKTECLANFTLTSCGCTPYYLPHKKKTTICGFSARPCIARVERLLFRYGSRNIFTNKFCNCLPLCNSVIYNIQPVYKRRKSIIGLINIRFKDSTFLAIERKEFIGNVDFWANCGGILGLFTGFSLLSLVEIVYYLTLRWMFVFTNYSKKIWSSFTSFL